MSFQSPSLFLFILVYQYFDRLPSQLGRPANYKKTSKLGRFLLPVFLVSSLINGYSSLFKVNATHKFVVSFYLKNVEAGVISRHLLQRVSERPFFSPLVQINLKGLKEGPPIKTDKGHEIAFQLTLVSIPLSMFDDWRFSYFIHWQFYAIFRHSLWLRRFFTDGVRLYSINDTRTQIVPNRTLVSSSKNHRRTDELPRV